VGGFSVGCSAELSGGRGLWSAGRAPVLSGEYVGVLGAALPISSSPATTHRGHRAGDDVKRVIDHIAGLA